MPRRTGLDDIDERIIAHLMEDGRRSNAVIAKDVGLSESSVRQRVARLRRDNVIRIAALTNPMRFGLWTAGVGITVAGGALEEVAEKLAAIPEVSYVSLCTGTCDISVGVVCKSHEHLLDVVANKVRSVGNAQQTELHIHVRMVKDSLIW